jgi:hypothetical protein
MPRKSRKGIKLGPRKPKLVRDLTQAIVDALMRVLRLSRKRAS